MSCTPKSLNMEIRKLRPIELYTLGIILNVSDAWKKLMSIVPKEENIPRFSSEHINMIERAAHQYNRNAAEIFLDEWSTMGRKRPTLETLLDLLLKAELYRAADYVACDILKQERPKRPTNGPAASIDISDATIKELIEEREMLEKDTAAELLTLGSSTEREIHKMFHEGKVASNLYKAINKNISCIVSTSEQQLLNPINIRKETNSENPLDIVGQQIHKYQEVSSQELPVFLNNSAESTNNENMSLSAYLPVFLNNSIQSATNSDKEMSSSDLPLCLKR